MPRPAETSKNGLALDYATAWSYGKAETLNLLVPDFMGRESGTTFPADGQTAAVLNDYGLRGAAQQLSAYWGTQPYTAARPIWAPRRCSSPRWASRWPGGATNGGSSPHAS